MNWRDPKRWCALHHACSKGHIGVVKLLLAHPAIKVNLKVKNGGSPLSYACQFERVLVVRELSMDSRVDISLADEGNRTPLWWASWKGQYLVVEWLMASGRDLGDLNLKGTWFGQKRTALEIARMEDHPEVVSLLERFRANPTQTCSEVRVKLGVLDELAAEVFALTVFLCDDLLQLKPAAHPAHPTAAATTRFFAIASKLPMELQMIICHRAVGSAKDNILSKDSEVAFKSLVRALLLLPSQSD